MTPEKFFDYLEGKMAPAEKEQLERALIADPELQRQFVSARQIHRGLQRPAGESAATARAGSRGRLLAAAFAVLVAMNVALGLLYIFRANKPPAELQQARERALRQQLQGAVAKSAAAAFPPPTIGMERIALTVPLEKQEEVAGKIIAAATDSGGSGTKGLPNESGFSVLVIVPPSGEAALREMLAKLGAAASTPGPATPEAVRLEIVLSSPR